MGSFSIALLLLGKSKPWRIALAIDVFVFGLASARLGEPFVGAAAGQIADGTEIAINVLLFFAIAELVGATAIKQIAPESWLVRSAMYVLAIVSVATMVWVAWLIGIAESGKVLVVTILWPVAAAVVFLSMASTKRRRTCRNLRHKALGRPHARDGCRLASVSFWPSS